VKKIPAPLGFRGEFCTAYLMRVKISDVEVNFQGQVNFYDLSLALSLHAYVNVRSFVNVFF
jgi:hypothetical protein